MLSLSQMTAGLITVRKSLRISVLEHLGSQRIPVYSLQLSQVYYIRPLSTTRMVSRISRTQDVGTLPPSQRTLFGSPELIQCSTELTSLVFLTFVYRPLSPRAFFHSCTFCLRGRGVVLCVPSCR